MQPTETTGHDGTYIDPVTAARADKRSLLLLLLSTSEARAQWNPSPRCGVGPLVFGGWEEGGRERGSARGWEGGGREEGGAIKAAPGGVDRCQSCAIST